jgi:hypothetical protein
MPHRATDEGRTRVKKTRELLTSTPCPHDSENSRAISFLRLTAKVYGSRDNDSLRARISEAIDESRCTRLIAATIAGKL